MSEVATQADSQVQVSSVVEEISQARARVAIPVVASLIIGVIAWLDGLPFLTAYQYSIPLILTYSVFGVLWLKLITKYPSATSKRRVVVIVGDLGMVSWGMVQMGDLGVIFYPLLLWVIVGNGMRFGAGYLITAIVVGQITFACIYPLSGYWQNNLTLGLSLQSGMIILPLFYLSLLGRMRGLNERLAQEAQRSRAAAESKALFLANMSHELRTPMNGVLGISALLADSDLNAEQHKLLEIIHGSADSLLGIINDILDYSKVDAGKLALEEGAFDLRRCIDDVVQLLDHKAEEKGLTLEFTYGDASQACFMGDRARLRQILVNLIGNAIKFTESGKVSVQCSATAVEDSLYDIELVVADTGVGIAAENLTRVFDQFEQEDASTARRFGGTGLGLAISRKIAVSMQGQLEVASEIGVGTAFTLGLKLEGVDAALIEDSKKVLLDRDYNLRALVAEDNRVNQIVARGLLEKLGIQVDIAENGQAALDKFAQANYEVVFMDMQMPIMGGEEAAQHIRDLPGDKSSVPIIALSANVVGKKLDDDSSSDRKDGIDLYNGFVGKPFTLQDLVNVVDEIKPPHPESNP